MVVLSEACTRRLRFAVGLAALALAAGSSPARAQLEPPLEPILPDYISGQDIEMHGRFVRQWKQDDGTLVLLFTGGFGLDFAGRQLSANSAVLWIAPRRSEPEGRKFYELTVYLSQDAQVREPAGTLTADNVLLVSNLRTYGRIVKSHDAHAPESLERSELYQRALADRLRIETERVAASQPTAEVEVARPQPRLPRPPRVFRYEFPRGIEPAETPAGEPAFVVTGRAYFSQSGTPDAPPLEIAADTAVVFPSESAARTILESPTRGSVQESPPEEPQPEAPPTPSEEIERGIRGVYLEGDVVLTLGERFLRADRVYYDFEKDRALILDGVFRTDIPERNVPLYVRAEEIRQLSAREFAAEKARVSTSEFYTPHYHVGAERVYLRDRTARDAAGRTQGQLAGTYELRNATLNIENIPLLWWPFARGDIETSETLLRRVRTGYSDRFGFELETAWHLFNLLGLEPPPGWDATLELDYFSKRGPAVGVNADYERQDQFGLFRGFYINDGGEDRFGPLRDNTPDSANRGRVLWRHRHYLPEDWEATLEVSYVSDPGFLEEYEKSEWFEGKQQETVLYLKRAKEIDAITFLANWRLLDFVTQTEHLPELTYRRIGDVLGPFVFYNEERIGAVRYRPDDRRFLDERRFTNNGLTDVTVRSDLREEAELPLKLSGFNAVPFISFRGSYWDGQPLDQGHLWRGVGVYGVRGSGYLARVYDDVRSELFNVNRIRHIIQPHYAAWWANSNTRSELITPFDEGIETIDAFYGGVVGVRQIWQTKRGGEGRERSVDLVTFNLEAGAFGGEEHVQRELSNGYANPIRPEDSRTRNYLAGDLIWRLSDTTSVLYDFNLDLDDGKLDRHDLSIAIERSPRLAYVFGYRHAADVDLDLVGGGYNYRLNEKHITALRVWADADRGRLGELSLAYIRKLPRWYFAINFEIDEVFDDVNVSVSMWPEGIPEWTLGSRRFTGLATSTGIRP